MTDLHEDHVQLLVRHVIAHRHAHGLAEGVDTEAAVVTPVSLLEDLAESSQLFVGRLVLDLGRYPGRHAIDLANGMDSFRAISLLLVVFKTRILSHPLIQA